MLGHSAAQKWQQMQSLLGGPKPLSSFGLWSFSPSLSLTPASVREKMINLGSSCSPRKTLKNLYKSREYMEALWGEAIKPLQHRWMPLHSLYFTWPRRRGAPKLSCRFTADMWSKGDRVDYLGRSTLPLFLLLCSIFALPCFVSVGGWGFSQSGGTSEKEQIMFWGAPNFDDHLALQVSVTDNFAHWDLW